MGRIIIITGKGGVGKTSLAAAHAMKSAREGKRTLLASADMAHNIGDIFGMRVGNRPVQLLPDLDGLELDPDQLLEEEFPDVARAFVRMLAGESAAGPVPDGQLLLPGLENLFSLLKLAMLHESGEYDRIIVDCAPTGETLSLLKLPELLAWYMEKFFPVGKTMVRLLSPVSRLRYHVSLPDRKAMNELEALHLRLLALQELLKDDRICSVRLVCTPERMVVEETKRSYMYLSLFRYNVDGVFINRVLPEVPDNAFLTGWRDIQKRYLDELHSVFAALPILQLPWYPREVRGQAAIGRICDEILTDPELFSLRPREENEVYVPIEGGYQLVLRIPGAEGEAVKTGCHALDLDISVGNYLRRIPLPNVLRGIQPAETSVRDGILRVSFLTGSGREERKEGGEGQ